MTKKSHDNLREVIARIADPKRATDGLKADRARIAKVLREARVRVKANKAKNNGAYVPQNDYDRYLANPNGPDPRD